MNKISKAIIIESHSYFGQLSIRGRKKLINGEEVKCDPRFLLKDAGFKEGDKVVIITEEEYLSLTRKNEQ